MCHLDGQCKAAPLSAAHPGAVPYRGLGMRCGCGGSRGQAMVRCDRQVVDCEGGRLEVRGQPARGRGRGLVSGLGAWGCLGRAGGALSPGGRGCKDSALASSCRPFGLRFLGRRQLVFPRPAGDLKEADVDLGGGGGTAGCMCSSSASIHYLPTAPGLACLLACLLPALPARSMTHAVKTSTAISPNLHPPAQHRLPSIPRTYDLLHALCHLAPSP